MTWFLFSILTAISVTAQDILSKKSLQKTNEYVVAWATRFFALLLLVPLLFIFEIPKLGELFWPALVINGSLNLLATICYFKAIKYSPLSLAAPMLTFTPLFLLLTSPVIVGEFPGWLGLFGVLFIVAGSYVLNRPGHEQRWWLPFKNLLREKGVRYMLLVALIWSITSVFDKVGVVNSSEFFWPVAVFVFIVIFITPLMLLKAHQHLSHINLHLNKLLPLGLIWGAMLVFQMIAVKLTLVAYVISIKRISAIFSVLGGALFFKEKGLKARLAGAILMVVGVVCIVFD